MSLTKVVIGRAARLAQRRVGAVCRAIFRCDAALTRVQVWAGVVRVGPCRVVPLRSPLGFKPKGDTSPDPEFHPERLRVPGDIAFDFQNPKSSRSGSEQPYKTPQEFADDLGIKLPKTRHS